MKPHKHKDLIIAWANGAKVQVYCSFDGKWTDCDDPVWIDSTEYRLKPQEDSLQKEKDHWKNGGDVQYYNPFEKQWFDVINKPNHEPDWNGLVNVWRIKPEPEKTKIEDTFNDQVRDDIDEILDCFDFQRVLKTMNALGWTYWYTDGVPDIWDVRKMARERLREAVKGLIQSGKRRWFSSSGGFRADAEIDEGDPKIYLSLKFVVSEWDNFDE